MKRSVAIIGPTPSFLRWAIWHPCALRELESDRLPDTTFRQLRAVREISRATIENRIFELESSDEKKQLAVHPDAKPSEPDLALGFSVDEVVGMFGGLTAVQQLCQTCPANVGAKTEAGLLAGCYGWLSADLNFDFRQVTRGVVGSQSNHESMVEAKPCTGAGLAQLIEGAIAKTGLESEISKHFRVTQPRWFGLWRQPVLAQEQLTVLAVLFNQVKLDAEQVRNASVSSGDLTCFLEAIGGCRKNTLSLHVELVPPGFSDGRHWTISAHCGECKFSYEEQIPPICPACGQTGSGQNAIKLKVLGLRPYLHLHSIIGLKPTQELLSRHVGRQNRHDQH